MEKVKLFILLSHTRNIQMEQDLSLGFFLCLVIPLWFLHLQMMLISGLFIAYCNQFSTTINLD